MSTVDLAIMLKLRAIRKCADILEEHMRSSEVLKFLENEDKDDEEMANDLIPQINYTLKAYSLRELSKQVIREEILAGDD